MNYFVFSYGGCGSTMFCNFLSQYGRSFHLHDKIPPLFLTNELRPAPGGHTAPCLIHMSQEPQRRLNPDVCRAIYLYRDPVVAKISRPSWQHCYHIGGMFEEHRKLIRPIGDKLGEILLQKYIKNGKDYNQYEEHIDNWMIEGRKREYSILYINYAYLWENLESIFEYCEISVDEIMNFPMKRETKKNIPSQTRTGLVKMYSSLQKKINDFNPIILSEKERDENRRNRFIF